MREEITYMCVRYSEYNNSSMRAISNKYIYVYIIFLILIIYI